MIASNQSVSKQTGWPIGVWYAELTHPYWAFSEAGYTVDIATPGRRRSFSSTVSSDPEDASGYSAFDYISLGFKKDSARMAMTRNTKKLSDVNPDDYKAIFVCGGQGPMYTFTRILRWKSSSPISTNRESPPPPSVTAPACCWKRNFPTASTWWKVSAGPVSLPKRSSMPTTTSVSRSSRSASKTWHAACRTADTKTRRRSPPLLCATAT